MKRDEVKIGKVYAAKINGRIAPVRIDRDLGTRFRLHIGMGRRTTHNGWEGRNMLTNREVHIHSPAKLRYEVENRGALGWVRVLYGPCGSCGTAWAKLHKVKVVDVSGVGSIMVCDNCDTDRAPPATNDELRMQSSAQHEVEALPDGDSLRDHDYGNYAEHDNP